MLTRQPGGLAGTLVALPERFSGLLRHLLCRGAWCLFLVMRHAGRRGRWEGPAGPNVHVGVVMLARQSDALDGTLVALPERFSMLLRHLLCRGA